jgi:hypothetical protein
MQTIPASWPRAQPLDDYLREVVQSLRQVTDRGIRKVHDHPDDAQHAIEDCEEILAVIMAGDVQSWLGG